MKKTNYSEIAGRYDKNKFRYRISPDEDLQEFINSTDKRPLNFLDLACGTGLYMKVQTQFFQNEDIKWHGLDASQEMLEKATEKVAGVDLRLGLAEDLPYDSCFFDFICNNNAFHHFQAKEQVIKEACRVLKPGGAFKIYNISIHDMRDWWIYRYFPAAYYEDLKRFWPKELVFEELSQHGFEVTLRLNHKREVVKLAEYLEYVINRDISVLTIISDNDYRAGLELMEYQLQKNPLQELIGDFAEVVFIARKRKGVI